jgi:hypothetical protein
MVVFVLIDKILATWRTVFVHPFPLSSTFAEKATKNWMTIWWLLYLVSTAGLLFRHFVICYSGPSYYRMFSRAYNNRNGQEHISIDVQMELIDKLAVRFYGYCLLALNNISKKTVKEAFYVAMVGHYHGMSREGLNFYGRLGYFCSLRTFDNMKKASIGTVDRSFRSVYMSRLCIVVNVWVPIIWHTISEISSVKK